MPNDPIPVPDRFEEPRDDPRFAAVFGRHLEELNQRGFIDPDEIVTLYPDLGAAVVEDLETYIQLRPEAEAVPGEEPLGSLGDYTLNREIGRGGMGVVYEAWEGAMDRAVALKVLPVGAAADARTFERFRREAQAAGKLTHANVVPVFRVGTEEKTPYYAMEYVEGATLGQVVKNIRDAGPDAGTPFGKRDQVDYFARLARAFAEVADGLQHAHSRGIIHRDIKPSNLILDTEGRLRILDFGLAQLEGEESLTLSGDVVGTPSYMSPEQARAKKDPIDHRTDVYSLGATLYEALTLRPPFRGASHPETISQILERDPERPRKCDWRIPAELETIVLKCLRKDRRERYGTAEAVAQDLRRFLRGDPIEAQPQSGLEKIGKRLWLYKGALTATTLVFIVIIAGLLVANTMIARARDEARYDLYVSNMRLAGDDFEDGNTPRFRELLERHIPGPDEPDLRGWEWYYLRSLREDASVATFEVKPGVSCVGWSADGRYVSAGQSDGSATIWDVEREEVYREWKNEGTWTWRLAWGPTPAQSHLLALGYKSGTLEFRDIHSEEILVSRKIGNYSGPFRLPAVRSLRFSGDGRWLSAATKYECEIWDTSSWQRVKTLKTLSGQIIRRVAWSPDHRHLAVALQRPVQTRVIDTETWEEQSYDVAAAFPRCLKRATDLVWSPDGAQLAAGDEDWGIRIWSVDGLHLEPHTRLDAGRRPQSLAWGRDALGPRLAAGCNDGTIKVWDLTRDQRPVVLRAAQGKVLSLAWDPTGERLVSGTRNGLVKIWEPERRADGVGSSGAAKAIWSPDGRWLAREDGAGSLSVEEVSTRTTVFERRIGIGARSLAFSPDRDSRWLAVATWGVVQIWDWREDEERPNHKFPIRGGAISWHPDGQLLAAGDKHNTCVVWDLTHAEPRKFQTLEVGPSNSSMPVRSLAWSPDGAWLAARHGVVVKIWDARAWEEVVSDRRLARGGGESYSKSRSCAWSADGGHLAAARGGELKIWTAGSWDDPRVLSAHGTTVTSLSWSPDGRRLATGSDDRRIKIWDTQTGEELLTLRGHESFINSLMWHPDGQRLLSTAGHRDSLKIWDARPAYEEGPR